MNGVLAFDTGPGNMVIDALAARMTNGKARYDDGGKMAAAAQVNPALLAWMMQDEYLKRTPPKTTGREMYGDAYVEQLLKKANELDVPLGMCWPPPPALRRSASARACGITALSSRIG